jgi:hypothetical protein
MLKFNWPISFIALVMMLLLKIDVALAFWIVLSIEFLSGLIILLKLRLTQAIDSFSISGILLEQYGVVGNHIYVETIVLLVGLRMVGSILGIFHLWFYIPTILLFLISTMRGDEKKEPG